MNLLGLAKVYGGITLVIISYAAPLPAVPRADITRAFEQFYNLDFDGCLAQFRRLAAQAPDEPELKNHVAQAILYREMFRAGALETELVTGGNAFLRRQKMNPTAEQQREFDETVEAAIRLAQRTLERNPNDTTALYALGVAHGLRANYNFVVRHAWIDALRDASTCRKYHNRVTELDPKKIDARMTQGVHDYVVGNLPWTYRALGFVAGFRGDKEQGIRTLEEVYAKGVDSKVDAAVLLATVYRRERRPSDAVPVLRWLIANYPRNFLFRLELAQMYSDLGDKKQALAAIDEVERLKRAGTAGYEQLPVEKVVYFRATVQFWYGDLDEALRNFQVVTKKAEELDPNTGVTAWMRLGQTYDLKGQRGDAVAAYKRAVAYAPGSYRAKESEGYLRSPYQRKQG